MEYEELAQRAGLPTGDAFGFMPQIKEFADLVAGEVRGVLIGLLEQELPGGKAMNWSQEDRIRAEVVNSLIESFRSE